MCRWHRAPALLVNPSAGEYVSEACHSAVLAGSSRSCAALAISDSAHLLVTFVKLIISPAEEAMLPMSRPMPSMVRVHFPASRSRISCAWGDGYIRGKRE